jgi:hypothetical protein
MINFAQGAEACESWGCEAASTGVRQPHNIGVIPGLLRVFARERIAASGEQVSRKDAKNAKLRKESFRFRQLLQTSHSLQTFA